jgi:S-adenosylmethionine:tRNA ribosyltransferase-isomerase
LLVVDSLGRIGHWKRSDLVSLFGPGDLVVANDAATLPASLTGTHTRSGRRIEVRLAGRPSLEHDQVTSFTAVLFGLGDFRMRTEDRPPPPRVEPGDRLALGPLAASITGLPLGHPRIVSLEFDGTPAAIWAGLATHGRPIQYSHLPRPLAIWHSWTPIAGPPVAFEPPSSGFALDWGVVASLRRRGAAFASITHAAGLSSTGDPVLDAHLPLDEAYRIPHITAEAIRQTQEQKGRVIAVGTTVVRALEHAATARGGVRPGDGMATQRIGAASRLKVVNAILSGTHEPGTSHYGLLRAFTDDSTLARMDAELNEQGYLTHEFGDSVFLERRQLSRVSAWEAS